MKFFGKFLLVVIRVLMFNFVEDKGCLILVLGLNLDVYEIFCFGFGGFL